MAADCGAGVGRVTEQLLLHHFAEVDLIEPSKHLIEKARETLSSQRPGDSPSRHRAQNYFTTGLQGWTPEAQRYAPAWPYPIPILVKSQQILSASIVPMICVRR